MASKKPFLKPNQRDGGGGWAEDTGEDDERDYDPPPKSGTNLPSASSSSAALAKFAKAKAPKHVKGAATDLNKFSLFEHMSGEERATNRVSPTSSPGIRRAMKAGLVKVEGQHLVLTDEGKKEQEVYEKKDAPRRVTRAESEIKMWQNIHKLAEERGDAGEAAKAKANITKHEGALEHAKSVHAKFSGEKPAGGPASKEERQAASDFFSGVTKPTDKLAMLGEAKKSSFAEMLKGSTQPLKKGELEAEVKAKSPGFKEYGAEERKAEEMAGKGKGLGHLSVKELKAKYDEASARTNSGVKPDDDWKAVTKELKERKLGTFQKMADALAKEEAQSPSKGADPAKISTEEKKADPKLNKLMQAHDDAYMRAKYAGSEAEKKQGEADLAEHKAKISAHVQAAHKEDAGESKRSDKYPSGEDTPEPFKHSKESLAEAEKQRTAAWVPPGGKEDAGQKFAPGSKESINAFDKKFGASPKPSTAGATKYGFKPATPAANMLVKQYPDEHTKASQQKQAGQAGQSIQTGTKGGRYYVNASGTKVYVK